MRGRLCGRVVLIVMAIGGCISISAGAEGDKALTDKQTELRARLKKLPFRIVYESYRGKDWELFLMNADGSAGANLTNTPDADDMYPHASPDGEQICFVVDQGRGPEKSRSVYAIGADGKGRRLIARDARQPCWSPDGRKIAYLPAEFKRFTLKDFATKGVVILDVKTGKGARHPNAKLHHLYNLCWSPTGGWFTATVHGGMGHKHANLAFEAGGTKVFKLPGVNGCRPDISPDGKKISWNPSDHAISIGDLQLGASGPKVTNIRNLVTCAKTHEVYHSDWSPDGKYVAFSYGPKGGEQVGAMAKGWHIAVADAAADNVWVTVTKDGLSNKEADWVALAAAADLKQARLRAELGKPPHKIVFRLKVVGRCAGPASLMPAQRPNKHEFLTVPCRLLNCCLPENREFMEAYHCATNLSRTFLRSASFRGHRFLRHFPECSPGCFPYNTSNVSATSIRGRRHCVPRHRGL